MTYKYKAVPTFWKAYHKLTDKQREQADKVLRIFKEDPFHISLNTHKINVLSARAKRTIYSATIAGNLRAVFYVEGTEVYSLDIGTHDIYK